MTFKYGSILVEGQTEYDFVKDVLMRGNPKYAIWKKGILSLVYRKDNHVVTTILDFYRLPSDFPERQQRASEPLLQQVQGVEQAWEQDIGARKFKAYISCQEFEALLFADVSVIARGFSTKLIYDRLRRIRQRFPPEAIDDETPPSVHLLTVIGAEYQKRLHGSRIARAIGLERIRAECPHFNDWVTTLEKLGNP